MKGLAAMGRLERVVLVVVVAGYVLLAVLLWQGKDFSKNGALSYSHRDQSAQLEALHTTAARVRSDCFRGQQTYGNVVKIVTAEIKGRRLYACYDVKDDGRVQGVQIVDADGLHLTDPHVLKPAGVWPYYAVIKSGNEFVLGGVGLVVLMGFGFFVSTRPRGRPAPPDSPWWGKGPVLAVLAAFIIAGWIVIAVLPRVPRARKARFVMWGVVGWGLAFGFTLFSNANDKHDPWGLAVMSYLAAGTILAVVLGVRARPRLGLNAREDGAGTLPPPVPAAQTGPVEAASTAGLVSVADPSTLPNFSAVGGMDALKGELKDTIGLMLAFTEQADAYRISWNGILLHGRPGTGKTFIAAATAGEFGLNFLHVAAGDLVSSYRGESARNVQAVFKQALSNVPALLFFDEFDSIAQRRDDNPDQEARRTVNQLLQSLEGTRSVRELVVMAATNDLGSLDPAVIRPGRFDRQIQVALPDLAARRSILAAQLRGRPGAAGVDVDALAQRMEGLTPAAIAQVVSAASIAAMKESSAASDGALVPLTTDRLVAALKARGGQDRPTVENWTWDRLVLPAKTKAELQEIAALAADPDRAKAYGVQAPSGV
ncbi:MAG: ATP-binding protein, partial [Actinobacteria bacterium]|nr:ATP-binding protein [Actinomycetota bacterium]